MFSYRENSLKIFLKIPDIISFMVQWRGTKKEKSLCKWGNFCLDFLSKFPYFYMYLIGCWCLTPTCQVFVFPNVGLFRFSHIDFIHPPIPTSSHILGGKHHSSDSLSVQFRKSATQIGRLTKTQLWNDTTSQVAPQLPWRLKLLLILPPPPSVSTVPNRSYKIRNHKSATVIISSVLSVSITQW